VDGKVELRYWLDFATQLVPQLQLASMRGAQKQHGGLRYLTGKISVRARVAVVPTQQSVLGFIARSLL
jgi:hypothetical protein